MDNNFTAKLKAEAKEAKIVAMKLSPEPEIKDFPFPLDAFPDKYKELIEHYVEFRSFPLDFFAVSVMTAVGSAFGSSHRLKTPDGYINRANYYVMIVAQPGINKSAPLEVAYMPIMVKQTAMFQAWRLQQSEEKHLKAELKAQAKREAAEAKKLAKCTDNADKVQSSNIDEPPINVTVDIESAESAESAGVKFIKPVMMDTTTEALIDQLSYNSHGTTIVYDELAGFINNMDKYRKGNDVQLYLSLFQGSHISRDTLTHGTIEISDPFVSIIGTIQPAELDNSFSGKIDNGFFDRFLICYLSNIKKPYPKRQDVNPNISGLYNTIINNLMELYYDNPQELTYSKDGYDVIYTWIAKSIDKENHEHTSDTERAIRAKMLIYIHRFALTIQMMYYSLSKSYLDKQEIGIKACDGATKLADYFLFMAEKTRIRNYGEVVTGQIKLVYDAILNEAPFTTDQFHTLAAEHGIGRRNASELLKRNIGKLWVKPKHGVYQKII